VIHFKRGLDTSSTSNATNTSCTGLYCMIGICNKRLHLFSLAMMSRKLEENTHDTLLME